MKTLLFSGLLAMLVPIALFSQEPSKNAASETAKLQVTQCALNVSGMTCGGCASCEVKNPSGKCCLGNVSRIVQEGFRELRKEGTGVEGKP